MTKRQDPDVKEMTPAQLRREVMRLRSKIRWYRDLRNNERCQHCTKELCSILPEEAPVGKMDGDPDELLRECAYYICRQKCESAGCDGSPSARRALRKKLERVMETVLTDL